MDLDVVFLGTAGSMPTAERSPTARSSCAAEASGCSSTAPRAPAAVAPLDARADRPPRGLPHPLPRRPLPRAAGDAEDVRPPRPRRADHDLRAARPARPVRVADADLRPAHLPRTSSRSSSPGRPSTAATTASSPTPSARRLVDRLRARRGRPPGAVRRRDRRPARRPVRPGARRPPARRARHARRTGRPSRPTRSLGPARKSRTVVIPGDTAPSEAVLEVATGADLLVHEATFLEDERERADETMHSTALDAAELARDAGVKLLALTHLSTRYFGRTSSARPARSSPRQCVPRDFDIIEIPFEERGAPRLVKGGARPPRRESPVPVSRGNRPMTNMVQVALAEDVTEAEELQAILEQAGIPSELETAVEHHPARDRGRTAEGARPGGCARGCTQRDRGADRARRAASRRPKSNEASPPASSPFCS